MPALLCNFPVPSFSVFSFIFYILLIIYILQDITGLAVQRLADRIQRRQPHRLCLIIFRIERFASVMSTSPASSVSPFLRFAIITSRLIMIMSFSSIRCSDRQVIFQLIGHSCIKDPGQHQRKKSRNHKYQDRDQYRRGQIKKQAQRSNCRNAETADSHPL